MILRKSHLVCVDGECKSFVAWFGVGIIKGLGVLLQLAQVEHVIKAVVLVGDDVKDHVTVILKGIYVMVDDHCSGGVLCLDQFSSLSVYQVDQSLSKKSAFR